MQGYGILLKHEEFIKEIELPKEFIMSKNKKKKKGSIIGRILWWIVLLISLGVFLFAAYQLLSIHFEYKASVDEYDDLKQFAATAPAGSDIGDVGDVSDEVEVEPGPQIDFAALKEVNEDVVGWLYVEALEDINYPIVQGKDNDYYLHRTFKQTYNFAGSIFLESTNKSDFSDPHNIVFGHNMKNGSMFGKLKDFRDPEVFAKSRYFWICTPRKNYKYEIFSVQEVLSGGDAYLLFSAPGTEMIEYGEKMQSQSEVETPEVNFTMDSRIATLSTCTTNTVNRLIVQGVQVN